MYQSKIRERKKRQPKSRVLIEPEDGQAYGMVTDLLGNGRARVLCEDGKARMGRIRGSMRGYSGRMIVEKQALVLISYRDWEEDKVDIFHRYTYDEAKKLVHDGCLPEPILKELNHCSLTNNMVAGSDDIVFANEEETIGEDDSQRPTRGYFDIDLGENAEEEEELDIDAI